MYSNSSHLKVAVFPLGDAAQAADPVNQKQRSAQCREQQECAIGEDGEGEGILVCDPPGAQRDDEGSFAYTQTVDAEGQSGQDQNRRDDQDEDVRFDGEVQSFGKEDVGEDVCGLKQPAAENQLQQQPMISDQHAEVCTGR